MRLTREPGFVIFVIPVAWNHPVHCFNVKCNRSCLIILPGFLLVYICQIDHELSSLLTSQLCAINVIMLFLFVRITSNTFIEFGYLLLEMIFTIYILCNT